MGIYSLLNLNWFEKSLNIWCFPRWVFFNLHGHNGCNISTSTWFSITSSLAWIAVDQDINSFKGFFCCCHVMNRVLHTQFLFVAFLSHFDDVKIALAPHYYVWPNVCCGCHPLCWPSETVVIAMSFSDYKLTVLHA